jgi:hypothetical protein
MQLYRVRGTKHIARSFKLMSELISRHEVVPIAAYLARGDGAEVDDTKVLWSLPLPLPVSAPIS